MKFWKLEGCGNSFVVLFDSAEIRAEGAAFNILQPHKGVGADGLMIVGAEKDGVFPVNMYNSDGSKAGMCGNGIRCVVRFLALERRIPEPAGEAAFSVWGRPINCVYEDSGRMVEVDMGRPSFDPEDVPVLHEGPMIGETFTADGVEFKGTALSLGNPHFVVKLEQDVDLSRLGPALSNQEIFPDRANIEFVRVLAPNALSVQVCERGVGFTLACGTGACASVVAGVKEGWCEAEASVLLPGGTLKVRFDPPSGKVFLRGPAREIFEGRMVEGV